MAFQTLVVGNFHAAENQFASGNQRVNIVTNSNVNHRREIYSRSNENQAISFSARVAPASCGCETNFETHPRDAGATRKTFLKLFRASQRHFTSMKLFSFRLASFLFASF